MENGVRINEYIFVIILGVCFGMRSFKFGKEVYVYVLKIVLIENSYISSGIVDVYCKCGNMDYV